MTPDTNQRRHRLSLLIATTTDPTGNQRRNLANLLPISTGLTNRTTSLPPTKAHTTDQTRAHPPKVAMIKAPAGQAVPDQAVQVVQLAHAVPAVMDAVVAEADAVAFPRAIDACSRAIAVATNRHLVGNPTAPTVLPMALLPTPSRRAKLRNAVPATAICLPNSVLGFCRQKRKWSASAKPSKVFFAISTKSPSNSPRPSTKKTSPKPKSNNSANPCAACIADL